MISEAINLKSLLVSKIEHFSNWPLFLNEFVENIIFLQLIHGTKIIKLSKIWTSDKFAEFDEVFQIIKKNWTKSFKFRRSLPNPKENPSNSYKISRIFKEAKFLILFSKFF